MTENEEPKKIEETIEHVSDPVIEHVSEQAIEPAPLMTQEEFSAQMAQLTDRARAAGLRPIQAMLTTYVKQGMTMLDKLLEGLEPVDSSKKKE